MAGLPSRPPPGGPLSMSLSMSLSAAEIRSRLLDRARRELPEQTFRTWLEPTEPLELSGDTIVVGAPDRFAAEWNESKHAHLLSSLAPIALGHPISVVFKVHEERKARPQMDFFVAPPPAISTPAAVADASSAGNRPAQLSARY